MKINHKFEIGEKVYVANCSDDVDEMIERIGTILTIATQTNGNWGGTEYPAYRTVEDNGVWFWREDWLMPVELKDISITENEIFDIIKE